MAQFVDRNLETEVKSRRQRHAKRHGRTVQEQVRNVLRKAVKEKDKPVRGLGTEIVSLFTKIGLDADIPELRGHKTTPISFD